MVARQRAGQREMTELQSYERRIRELAPDLAIGSIRLNQDGLMNDVVIVNEEIIFRFPKHEYARHHLKHEANILRLLQKHLTLEIPCPLFANEEVLSYRLIPGETLRRDMLLRLAADDQQAVADQLAQFFRELHAVPVHEGHDFELPPADALMDREGWLDAYARIRAKVFPLLQAHARAWATEHFESHLNDESNFEYELKMVDTDIGSYHILFDRQRQRINGVIDFGCAGLGDPAIDFGVVINTYGESFLRRFYQIYPAAEEYLKRARFYAGAIELRWLLTGIERNDPTWFAVHVGTAKDFGYND